MTLRARWHAVQALARVAATMHWSAECHVIIRDSNLNSAGENTIFDIVKRHIAVLDDRQFKFKLKLRASDCRWHYACIEAFNSTHPALLIPARVFN
jgi:hypothetical protein